MARGLLVAVLACSMLVAAAAVGGEMMRGIPDEWVQGERASGDAKLTLTVAVAQTNLKALEDVLFAVSEPDSPKYGQHLTRDEVDALVAPKPESVAAVLEWLQAGGVESEAITKTGNGDFVIAETTVAVAEALLGAEYFQFRHRDRHTFQLLRLASGYTLPPSVASVVDFVGPSVRFPRLQRMTVSKPTSNAIGVTPTFLRKLYNVGDATGKAASNRQGVAQFLGQYYSPSDLQSFFSQFAPAQKGANATVVGPNQPSNPGDEASLDIEYIMSVAAGVPTDFWSTSGQQPHNPGNEPFLTWLTNVAKTSGDAMPKTFSVSYGDDENGVNFDYAVRVNAEFMKAGARGISLMFASGDGGVGGSQPSFCTKFIPTFPAASPYVTAVGGTSGYNPESTASLSGGGFSNYWARPKYQDSFVDQYFKVATNLPASDLYNHTGAGFPDVAAQALSFNIVLDGFTTLVDGTSCASPTFASVISLLTDYRLQNGKSPLGYLNPLLYKNPSAFNDVTTGNNPGCNTNGFTAAVGWDPDTGLGTPDYAKLKTVVSSLP